MIRERNHQPAPQWLLAIDTASDNSGIALFDGETLHESSWISERDHTVRLLPEVELMMQRAGLARSAVGVIGVITGPGMYSSLRVGLSVAKGFALALEIPILGVNTFDVIESAVEDVPAVIAVVESGRGRVSWRTDNDLDLRTGSIQELIAGFSSDGVGSTVVGDLRDDQVISLLAAGFTVPPPGKRMRRPADMARIAYRRWQNGEFDDLASLEATYLKPRSALAATSAGD